MITKAGTTMEEIINNQADRIADLIYICKVQADQIALLQNPRITISGGDIKAPEGWPIGGISPAGAIVRNND